MTVREATIAIAQCPRCQAPIGRACGRRNHPERVVAALREALIQYAEANIEDRKRARDLIAGKP